VSEPEISRWRAWLQEANADEEWKTSRAEVDATRTTIVPELLDLLQRFLDSSISLEQFRAEFDQRTRTDWTVFGLKGLSGAMYLNMLTKYVPDREELTRKLQAGLPAPSDEPQAHARMSEFVEYLNDLIQQQKARRRKLQPARAPYLLSAWWHLQEPEKWPIFYQSGRNVLELERAYLPEGDPVDDYFAFRRVFQSLAHELGLGSWQCEHLLGWREKKSVSTANIEAPVVEPTDVAADDAEDTDESCDVADEAPATHVQIQWLLARIGQKVGCEVWIAKNDQSKCWNDQQLGGMSVAALPSLGLDDHSQKLISLIDLVWLKGKHVVAAFEVEHTTSIFSGLLRLSDLVVECPNLNFPLYIVAPEHRLDRVRKQLSRPTFQELELHRRCAYFSDEALVEHAAAMLQWATDPKVIDQLATRVGELE
jgi:hypothetical protein